MENEELKSIENDLKGVAKVIATIQEVYRFTTKYWYILGFLCAAIWGVTKTYYKVYAEPEIRNYIVVVAKDSLAPLVPLLIHAELDTILKKKGVSFRVQIAEGTGLQKDSVSVEFAKMYKAFLNQRKEIDSLRRFVSYMNGVTNLFAHELFQEFEATNGAKILYAPSGDSYYFDYFGLLWGANLKADGNYYFYPPYLNNARMKCTFVQKD